MSLSSGDDEPLCRELVIGDAAGAFLARGVPLLLRLRVPLVSEMVCRFDTSFSDGSGGRCSINCRDNVHSYRSGGGGHELGEARLFDRQRSLVENDVSASPGAGAAATYVHLHLGGPYSTG